MRWMGAIGVVVLAALAVFLFADGQRDTQLTDADGRASRDGPNPKLLRSEGAAGVDAAGVEVEGSERNWSTPRSVADGTSSEAGQEHGPSSEQDGTGGDRDRENHPTLKGAGRVGETRGADDAVPTVEPAKGPVVHVRVVREGSQEPLPGALVVFVDAAGKRHEQRADAKGVARFVDLAPGDGEADALNEGWVSRWLVPVKAPVAGRFECDLRMQAAVSIRGVVRAAHDGRAVAGARVTAVAGGSVHGERGRSSSSRGVYATVETDAAGRFRFSALPKDDVCTLAVLARGYRYGDLGVIPTVEPNLPVEIQLEKGGRVLGRVLDPEGQPVGGAEVFVFRESQPYLALNPRQGRVGREPEQVSLRGISGDDGQFEVVGLALNQSYAATAFAQGHVRAENASGIVVTEAASATTITLAVGLAAGVQIRLLDSDGRPVAGAGVLGYQRGRFSQRVASAADGTARLEGIPPGMLLIRVTRDGFRALKTTVEVVAGDVLELDLNLEPLPPGVEVSGVAVDKDGKPIPHLTIVATSLAARQTRRTTTTEDGRFVLRDVQAGKVRINAAQQGFKRTSLEIDAPAENVHLVVLRFTQIRGRVQLPAGMAKPDLIYLAMQPLEGGVGGGGSVLPFQDGTFEAFVNPDIELRLHVCADTFAPWTRQIRVREGETLDLGAIPVVAGMALAGVVLDPDGEAVPGAVLEVELTTFVRRSATSDADGRFRLEHLPAETLPIKVLAKGYPEQKRDVEATATLEDVRLVLTRGK